MEKLRKFWREEVFEKTEDLANYDVHIMKYSFKYTNKIDRVRILIGHFLKGKLKIKLKIHIFCSDTKMFT